MDFMSLERYRYWLPVVSAVLLILALPPISLSPLALVGLVPMLVFSYTATQPRQAALGWALFSGAYVSYITYTTIAGFQWMDEATLFVGLIKAFGVAVMLGGAVSFGVMGYVTKHIELLLLRRVPQLHRFIVVVLFAMVSALTVDYVLYTLFSGFNYGALFFAGQHLQFLLGLIDLGHPVFISLAVVLGNVLAFVTVLVVRRKISLLYWLGTVVVVVLYFMLPVFIHDEPVHTSTTGKVADIAIIQDATRAEAEAFGEVQEGVFSFPELEAHLASLEGEAPDYIIYPFGPWNGVMGSYADNARFDRKVIAIDEATFGTWLKAHVPSEVIFVTWFTTYEAGNYYNQIVYYKNGERIGTYNKRHLFPFFDYTPAWALRMGIVSLPFDGTPGDEAQQALAFDTLRIGSLVCSEIGDDASTALSAQGSNMLFSIGSESMFTHQIPSEYNALRAQLSAEYHNIPVVRANRFGPSVVYDGNGTLLGAMDFGETGILRVTVPYGPMGE